VARRRPHPRRPSRLPRRRLRPHPRAPVQAPAGEAPETTFPIVLAIITTTCCCLPFGVVAIIFAVQASSAANTGDYAGAEEKIRQSKMWSMIGMALGALAIAVYIGLMVVGAMAQ
jgi:hypothetical protein